MSAGVIGEHFLKELDLHTWLREWGSMDGCGVQGSRVHTWSDWGEPEGGAHVSIGLD